jgi:hypothetical protein
MLFIIIIFSLFSCKDTEYRDLSSNTKKYLLYKENDSIQLMNGDTMEYAVTEIIQKYDYSSSGIDIKDIYEEVIQLKLTQLHNDCIGLIEARVITEEKDRVSYKLNFTDKINIEFEINFEDDSLMKKSGNPSYEFYKHKIYPELTINDYSYDSVYETKIINDYGGEMPLDTQVVYYNFSHGFIKSTYKGQTYYFEKTNQ